MASSQTPRRSNTIHSEGEKYRIKLYDEHRNPDYNGKIDLIRDRDGEIWEFGVDRHGVAHLQTTTVLDDIVATPELPEWVEFLLDGLNVTGIKVE